jgi:hypothetical protein
VCNENLRELEADFINLRERFRDLERQHQRNLWMLIVTAGGRVDVPRQVVRDSSDAGSVVVKEDPSTGVIHFFATLHEDGVSRPSM